MSYLQSFTKIAQMDPITASPSFTAEATTLAFLLDRLVGKADAPVCPVEDNKQRREVVLPEQSTLVAKIRGAGIEIQSATAAICR